MFRNFLNHIRIGLRAIQAPRTPPQGLALDLLKLQVGGPPGSGDQVLWTLLLRDPPGRRPPGAPPPASLEPALQSKSPRPQRVAGSVGRPRLKGRFADPRKPQI
jgi:hypothetical protein